MAAARPPVKLGLGVTPAALWAVAVRPARWPSAIGALVTLAAPGWWRTWPPVPRPDPGYLRFRAQTMFGGDGSGRLGPAELLGYLDWYRDQHRGRLGLGPGGRSKTPGERPARR